MSSGFSSSGASSNQAKEGTENVQGSEFSTGGTHSIGMSSSGTTTNQADAHCLNGNDIQGSHVNITSASKLIP